ALFPLAFALYVAAGGRQPTAASLGRRLSSAAAFAAVAFAPLVVYRSWLSHWLQGSTVEKGFNPLVPFGGLVAHWSTVPLGVIFLTLTIAIPGLIWAGYATKMLVRSKSDVFAW